MKIGAIWTKRAMQAEEAAEMRGVLRFLRQALDAARDLRELKYNPDQPRLPAGSPGGGQWTDGGDGYALEPAANRMPPRVDLRREEKEGGHAIERHVGRSNGDLVRTLEGERLDTPSATAFAIREGSFNDLASANSYVNDVLQSNPDRVDAVASGQNDEDFSEKRYNSPTGREAYRNRSDENGIVRLRETFSVGVYIKHARNNKGFTVRTAYPLNGDGS